LFGVAWLQRCQRRQEQAFLVHKAEHVGDIAKRQLLIKRIFVRGMSLFRKKVLPHSWCKLTIGGG
jgi:hypothetical protein